MNRLRLFWFSSLVVFAGVITHDVFAEVTMPYSVAQVQKMNDDQLKKEYRIYLDNFLRPPKVWWKGSFEEMEPDVAHLITYGEKAGRLAALEDEMLRREFISAQPVHEKPDYTKFPAELNPESYKKELPGMEDKVLQINYEYWKNRINEPARPLPPDIEESYRIAVSPAYQQQMFSLIKDEYVGRGLSEPTIDTSSKDKKPLPEAAPSCLVLKSPSSIIMAILIIIGLASFACYWYWRFKKGR